MKKKIFDIIQVGEKSNRPSRIFDYLLVANILLNILVVILETYDSLNSYTTLFRTVEVITTLFFCVEYILRLWTADLLYPKKTPGKARLRFLISYDGIVDLFTIIPVFFLSGAVVFRMLRVVRIFHLFRINAQYDSFNVITTVLKEKGWQIMSSLSIILILMLAGSIFMYSAEHEAQPDVFKNAFSGFWWSVNTMLTIGYGDIYPVTAAGKIMATILSFLGVGAVAIPTGIISAGFVEQFTKNENAVKEFRDMGQIGEVYIDEDSELLYKTIGEIHKSYDMKIYLLLRDELSVLPEDNITVYEGDILVTRSEKVKKDLQG